jgi:HAAS domain-containing protein
MIDHYVNELSAQLAHHGIRGRRAARLCAEARDHLLELAEALGDEEAIARFGPPGTLAIEAARVVHPVMLLRSTLVFLAALVLFVLPLYAIPENTLPPAPWDARPDYLTWKLYVSDGAFAIAVLAALVALAAAWRHRRRTTLVALTAAGGSLAASAAIGAIGTVQWAQAVPGAGTTLALSLGTSVFLGLVAAASLASAHRVHRLARDLPG